MTKLGSAPDCPDIHALTPASSAASLARQTSAGAVAPGGIVAVAQPTVAKHESPRRSTNRASAAPPVAVVKARSSTPVMRVS